ncbi:MAG: hypothetical protein HQ483_09905 [Rhodospirillales bacterium]|nr:hypothetical protein [Rhodospirillales bacterium]
MDTDRLSPADVASKLIGLYSLPFGGKASGRFRISPKNLRRLSGRRRLSDEFVQQLAEELFELDYVFVDLGTYYVMTNTRAFANYRRVSDALLAQGTRTG